MEVKIEKTLKEVQLRTVEEGGLFLWPTVPSPNNVWIKTKEYEYDEEDVKCVKLIDGKISALSVDALVINLQNSSISIKV